MLDNDKCYGVGKKESRVNRIRGVTGEGIEVVNFQ